MSFQFEYEISSDEFVAASTLYYKLSRRRVPLHQKPLLWIFIGVFFAVVGWQEEKTFNSGVTVLLVLFGVWWIYAGFTNLFPTRYFRKVYSKAVTWGDRFKASVNTDGFEVEGEVCAWRVRWQGVKVKGEDDLVFVFYCANTMFIFGKRYLNSSQQEEMRRLSGIQAIGSKVSGL